MERFVTTKGVFLKSGDRIALFQPESMRLLRIDATNRYSSLCDVASKVNLDADESIASTMPISDPLNLSQRQALLPIMLNAATMKTADIRPSISRLTLNISNVCNLSCVYCYADHGSYHSQKSQMVPERVHAILEKILSLYRSPDVVHYFGGEPLLNLAAINAGGTSFEKAVMSGRISSLPKFVVTTNGTISSDHVIETLKRWGIQITVSWDGNKEIQDLGRPMTRKGSSYQKVTNSIDRFSNNSIPYGIECTFNASHIRAGFSIVNLLDFFAERTGQRIFHIAPSFTPGSETQSLLGEQQIFRISHTEREKLSVDTETIVSQYRDAARYTAKNFLRGTGPLLEFAYRIIEQIVTRKRSVNYCPAFFNQLSVAVDGSVFPCFMFIGDPDFYLGNLLTDDFPTEKGSAVLRRYFDEFGLVPVGTGLWYRGLFGGCIAGDYISNNTLNTRHMAPMYEAMIEECLVELAFGEQTSTSL